MSGIKKENNKLVEKICDYQVGGGEDWRKVVKRYKLPVISKY